MTDLAQCPFCGGDARLDAPDSLVIQVGCGTARCVGFGPLVFVADFDDKAAAVAAAAAAWNRRASPWRTDMENAPKDGTPVDLMCKRSWEPPEPHERRCDIYWCTTHKRWRTVENSHYVEDTFVLKDGPRSYYLIPIAWMPIPSFEGGDDE